jgi:hypothetical protein
MALHGTDRTPHLTCDLGFAEVTEVSEYHRLTLATRQPSEGGHEIASLAQVRVNESDRTGHWLRGSAAAAVAVDSQVRGDPRDPALGPVFEASPAYGGSGQGFLCHIFGVTLVAQDPKGHAIRQAVQALKGQVEAVGNSRRHQGAPVLASLRTMWFSIPPDQSRSRSASALSYVLTYVLTYESCIRFTAVGLKRLSGRR